jgi:hypothetical protein
MPSTDPIERCLVCLRDEITKRSVVEECLPVRAFGDYKNNSVKVAIIGINPALDEFQIQREWKQRHLRLSIVQDYGVEHRGLLSDTAITDAISRREKYFSDSQRVWHSYFDVLDCFLGRVNSFWSFASGNAVHIDLIACATVDKYSGLNIQCQKQLRKNCSDHFTKTLSELPNDTLLLLNGWTGYNAMHDFSLTDSGPEELINILGTRGWSGKVSVKGREHSFCGWNSPVGKMPRVHRNGLADWVKQKV